MGIFLLYRQKAKFPAVAAGGVGALSVNIDDAWRVCHVHFHPRIPHLLRPQNVILLIWGHHLTCIWRTGPMFALPMDIHLVGNSIHLPCSLGWERSHVRSSSLGPVSCTEKGGWGGGGGGHLSRCSTLKYTLSVLLLHLLLTM